MTVNKAQRRTLPELILLFKHGNIDSQGSITEEERKRIREIKGSLETIPGETTREERYIFTDNAIRSVETARELLTLLNIPNPVIVDNKRPFCISSKGPTYFQRGCLIKTHQDLPLFLDFVYSDNRTPNFTVLVGEDPQIQYLALLFQSIFEGKRTNFSPTDELLTRYPDSIPCASGYLIKTRERTITQVLI